MTIRDCGRIVLMLLVLALSGCDDTDRSPTGPSPLSTTAPTQADGSILVMSGTVSDTAFRHLPGAKVEVVDGPGAGKSTVAGPRGEFSLAGPFDETTQFRATSDGHVTSVRTLQPFCERCNPNWWINFTLDVVDQPINISGLYTLTFVADSTCTRLPEQVRTRSFTATIGSSRNPAGGYIDVTVDGGLAGWNVIPMGVSGNYVSFWLETLVEQTAPDTFLTFAGVASASVDASARSPIVLPFHGSIDQCVTTSDPGTIEACFRRQGVQTGCGSNSHQLILTQR